MQHSVPTFYIEITYNINTLNNQLEITHRIHYDDGAIDNTWIYASVVIQDE